MKDLSEIQNFTGRKSVGRFMVILLLGIPNFINPSSETEKGVMRWFPLKPRGCYVCLLILCVATQDALVSFEMWSFS